MKSNTNEQGLSVSFLNAQHEIFIKWASKCNDKNRQTCVQSVRSFYNCYTLQATIIF